MKKEVIIDSDIGDDIDDACALVFALNSPELDIKAIISNNGHEKDRARIIHKLVKYSGKSIPVFSGINGGIGRLSNQKQFIIGYNFNPSNIKDKINFFKKIFRKNIIYISLGSLTNAVFFLKNILGMKNKVKFYVMGGTINTDYHGKKRNITEWNFACDKKAAIKFFNLDLNIILAGLDCTWDLELKKKYINRIKNSDFILDKKLSELYFYWKKSHKKRNPICYDSFTVGLAIDKSLSNFKDYKISIDKKGRTIRDKNKGKTVKVAVKAYKNKFMKLFMKRIIKL